jgi:hypothetical protein
LNRGCRNPRVSEGSNRHTVHTELVLIYRSRRWIRNRGLAAGPHMIHTPPHRRYRRPHRPDTSPHQAVFQDHSGLTSRHSRLLLWPHRLYATPGDPLGHSGSTRPHQAKPLRLHANLPSLICRRDPYAIPYHLLVVVEPREASPFSCVFSTVFSTPPPGPPATTALPAAHHALPFARIPPALPLAPPTPVSHRYGYRRYRYAS